MYFIFKQKTIHILILLSFVASLIAYPFSSTEVPLHFDGWNRIDIWVNKNIGLFVFPVFMLIFLYIRQFFMEATYAIYLFIMLHIFILYMAIS